MNYNCSFDSRKHGWLPDVVAKRLCALCQPGWKALEKPGEELRGLAVSKRELQERRGQIPQQNLL